MRLCCGRALEVIISGVFEPLSLAATRVHAQSILKWSTVEEVIARANNTMYGLAAGVWTRNLDTANTIGRALKAGTIWTNTWCVRTFLPPLAAAVSTSKQLWTCSA